MIPNDDHKRLFLDMQEHPENYSDEQLEAMMDDLDSDLDAQAAWERFEQTAGCASRPSLSAPSSLPASRLPHG